MSDNDVDISAEAAQDAAAVAAQEAAAQEAMEAAQQEAYAQAQDLAVADDGPGLAELAAAEGDPFDEDVDDGEELDDADDSASEVEESEQSTENATPAPMSEDAFVPDETETVQSEPESQSEPEPETKTESQPESTDSTEVITGTPARPESQTASAVMAQSGPSSKARADALTSMSSADFRRRLRDEQVKHSGGLVANEGYVVRTQLDQARRRGVELGLIDEEVLKQFDDEMAYNDSTLDEDQRSAYGPGSPMYEEAKRLGYIIEGDRTSSASSMRIRDAQDARREAEERLRFHHYWQQQAARDYLTAMKAVMQAEDADNGAGAGFSQLGRLLADLTVGDGVDEAELDEYIAAQSDESEDVANESVVEDAAAPEQTSPSKSDLNDLDAAIEEYEKARQRQMPAHEMQTREARACELEAAARDAVNTVVDECRRAESVPVQTQSEPVEVVSDMPVDTRLPLDERIVQRRVEPTVDAAVVFDQIDRIDSVELTPELEAEWPQQEVTEKKEDTDVTIQEFVDAWGQFSAVERRIVLRRTGLVNADEMEEVYTELQATVQERTNERDRYHEECNQLRADLEYETGVRRDAEREVAQLRNSVNARGPRG